MYQPPHFREERLDVQHALIRAHPLGMLVTIGSGGLSANPLPFHLDPDASERGTLRAHLSRANAQWRDFDPSHEALVIFQGVDTYVTPSWYETKRETGKVVPTWNYALVQAYGPLKVIDDPQWLIRQIGALTARHEASQAKPWSVEDAPPAYIEAQLRGIIGIEIPIGRIEGKWKVSQNRNEPDRTGVAAGLRATEGGSAQAMADLVDVYGAKSAG